MTSVRGHPQPTDTWSGAVDRYDTVAGASRLTRCARRTAFLVSYSGLGRLRSHVCKAVFPARQSPALLCPEAEFVKATKVVRVGCESGAYGAPLVAVPVSGTVGCPWRFNGRYVLSIKASDRTDFGNATARVRVRAQAL